jgi:hypothetical protein
MATMPTRAIVVMVASCGSLDWRAIFVAVPFLPANKL